MVILKVSDDGLNVDDRGVNLCRLLMMTRQTTWSVLGSNLQQLGITENQQDDDDQNDDIDSYCVGKNTATGMDYRADVLGRGGCFLADVYLCPAFKCNSC